MKSLVAKVAQQYQKPAVVSVRSGDSVRVHQRIKEGSKERVQMFEGMVIRVDRKNSLTYRITVRRVSGGVGVEKGFMMHAPSTEKVEVIKRSTVRRNYLSYIRQLTGKSVRLKGQSFDASAVNKLPEATQTEDPQQPEASHQSDDKQPAPEASSEPPAKTDQPEVKAEDSSKSAESKPEADTKQTKGQPKAKVSPADSKESPSDKSKAEPKSKS